MLGMLSLGFIADKIGRKWGSVTCASFMFVGGILLTASSGPTLAGWATMFTISQVRNRCSEIVALCTWLSLEKRWGMCSKRLFCW